LEIFAVIGIKKEILGHTVFMIKPTKKIADVKQMVKTVRRNGLPFV